MKLELSATERDALIPLLETAYLDLRGDLDGVYYFDLRRSLDGREQLLASLLDRLDPGWAARRGVDLAVTLAR